MARRRVSVITTVLNEAESIGPLLESLLAQSRDADEIVICDAGSTDGTIEAVRERIEDGYPARLIVERGANRARGRNRAIEETTGEIIAVIDAGCTASLHWLSNLLAPLEADDPPDVVGGYYEPDTDSPLEDAVAVATVPDPSEVDPGAFLPSSRSVAFTRGAWERVVGYPEHCDYAEDTEFDLRMRAAGLRFAFAPEALVRWRMESDFVRVFRQFRRYARSDGELGHRFGHYTKAFVGLAVTALLALLTAAGSRGAPVLLILLLAAYWARYTARARRRGADWYPALVSPGVSLTVDLAHVVGYTAGLLRRRPRPPALPTDRSLSIAQVTYTYQPVAGGADVYAGQLAELIAAAGHEHRAYQRLADTDAAGLRFVPNPLRGRPFEFWTHALGLFQLRRELLAHDVVICHYPHLLLAIDLMGLFRGRPVRIGVSHGVFWDDAPWWSPRSLVKLLIARLAFRRAHLTIANDTHYLRAMGLRIEPRQGMHAPVSPGVWFIPNGVDTGRFRPTEPHPEFRERGAVLVPRNLFRNRGIHLAVEAFAQFHPRHVETTLFIVGGGGQPAYVDQLKREVEVRGLRRSVVFAGPVAHTELPAVYSAARLTLIPSLCGEGTSLSALESMACGVATICTHVAGLRDLPGPHALPFVASLVETMESVYSSREKVGEDQRAAVLASYSLDRWRDSWMSALRGVGVAPQLPSEG